MDKKVTRKYRTNHYYQNFDAKDNAKKNTTIRFGKKLDKKLIAYSKKHKRPMSTIVREALMRYLK